jgi:hypothetical protein
VSIANAPRPHRREDINREKSNYKCKLRNHRSPWPPVGAVGISGGLRTPELCLTFDEDGFGRPGNPLWTGLHAYARYGAASIFGGRSISDCVDCGGSDLTVTSGTFLDTGVNLGFKLGDGLGGSVVTGYRHYFGGASIAGELQITLGFWLF